MDRIVENIRKISKRMLAEGTVAGVLGFKKGSIPMSSHPFLARTLEDAESLWWDDFCVMNLANFIPKKTGKKIAVLAKGCDARNLVVHHLENRLQLEEDLIVLGVSCQGMIAAEKVRQAVGDDAAVQDIRVCDQTVAVAGADFRIALQREDVLRQACLECRYPDPVFVHEWISEAGAGTISPNPTVASARTFSGRPADRLKSFEEMFSECIHCYACRDACPLCYCRTCFVDKDKTLWLGEPCGALDKLSFHFFRALHLAGRCTDCGACESACPAHIPVRLLAHHLTMELKQACGYDPGIDLKAVRPEHIFRPDYHERLC